MNVRLLLKKLRDRERARFGREGQRENFELKERSRVLKGFLREWKF